MLSQVIDYYHLRIIVVHAIEVFVPLRNESKVKGEVKVRPQNFVE